MAIEREPSLGQETGEDVYTSVKIGRAKLPITSPIDLLSVTLKAARSGVAARSRKPMAVYAYNQDPENVVAGFVLKLLFQTPLVVVYHHLSDLSFASMGDGIAARRRGGYNWLAAVWRSVVPALNRFSSQRADVHLALSESTKADVKSLLGVDRCDVVGNGLDAEMFRPLGLEKRYEAVFLGRIVHQKGVDTLLRAWAVVARERPGSRLVLIGGVDERGARSYQGLAEELGIRGAVDFKGFQNDDEVVRLLNESRLFVFPTRKEGFAQAVSQAMGCGLCCILSDIPPLRETYGEVALFVPPDSPDDLAAAISEALDHPERCAEIGARSRRYVQKFDWGAVVEKELTAIKRQTRR